MFIELRELNEIIYGGYILSLPGKIKRYIDFENSTAALLQSNELKLIFIGLIQTAHGETTLDIINEYCIEGEVVSFKKVLFNNKESLNIRINDIIQIFDPDDGIKIYEVPTKG